MVINMAHRILRLLLSVALVCMTAALLCLGASGAKTLTRGVSILNPKQNIHGDGYEWHNPSDTLTLSNLRIDTSDEFGLKIPDGATVILKGKNYIKASKAALYIGGNVVIRGSGTLTLEGGETGILCNSIQNSHQLRINSGTYVITGGTDGIRADYSKIALAGGNLTISGGSGHAITARELQTAGGVTVRATRSLHASYSLLLQGANLSVESDQPALLSDGSFKTESMTFRTGDSLSSLSDAEGYDGEKALATVSTLDTTVYSILFGSPYPIIIDVCLLVGALLILAAAIVIPLLLRRNKAKKIMEQIRLEEEELRRQHKAEKKKAAT